jgi:subtilisin family serine protease
LNAAPIREDAMSRSRKLWSLSLLLAAALCPHLGAQDLSLDARAATVISLSSRVIDTSGLEPALPEALRARPADSLDPDGDVVLVKFPGPVTAGQEEALRAASLRVYTYLPFYAYLVKMPAGAQTGSLLASLGASWSGLYHPAYKISREVAAVEPGEKAPEGKEEDRLVMVQVYPDADLVAVIRAMKELGVKEILGAGQGSFFSRIRLLLTPTEIAALREPLAAIRGVFWIGLEGRRTLLNDTTVWVGQSGLSGGQTTPIFSQGIFGEGQVVAVLDTGIDPDMCYFRDPAFGLPPTNLCNGGITLDSARRKVMAVDFLTSTECAGGIAVNEWDTQGHGTHVAGTVAGDNFANPLLHDTADGMAPGARLVIQDGGFQTDNCGDLPGIGCPVVDLKPIFQQAYDQGARLHTNSWGDNENAVVQNNYSAGSQDVDEFMWNHKDFLIFFAAGNSGPGTASVSSPSTAKSGVSVGATLRSTSANSMASFSSCGPTADGRIKPEVTVPGSSIVSARNDGSATSNNCGTTTLSGTSMATPGAAGLTALIRQYFTDGWYPTGSKVAANGFTPSAALLKATLVSSAINMTNTTVIPANCQGWGRVLLEDALYFNGQTRRLWVKDDAAPFPAGSTSEERTFSFQVTAGEPFKVTLAWTDFPSTPAAIPNLNDDLDLIVTGPTGTVWRGNVFSGGVSTTGGAADRRNTLEQVLLAAPAAGLYTVTVRSPALRAGGHRQRRRGRPAAPAAGERLLRRFREPLGLDAQSRRHRQGHRRPVGAGRSGRHQLRRPQAARRDRFRSERPGHGASGRSNGGGQRRRRRHDHHPVAAHHAPCDGHGHALPLLLLRPWQRLLAGGLLPRPGGGKEIHHHPAPRAGQRPQRRRPLGQGYVRPQLLRGPDGEDPHRRRRRRPGKPGRGGGGRREDRAAAVTATAP